MLGALVDTALVSPPFRLPLKQFEIVVNGLELGIDIPSRAWYNEGEFGGATATLCRAKVSPTSTQGLIGRGLQVKRSLAE